MQLTPEEKLAGLENELGILRERQGSLENAAFWESNPPAEAYDEAAELPERIGELEGRIKNLKAQMEVVEG